VYIRQRRKFATTWYTTLCH